MPILETNNASLPEPDLETEFKGRPILLVAAKINQFFQKEDIFGDFHLEEVIAGVEMVKLGLTKASFDVGV